MPYANIVIPVWQTPIEGPGLASSPQPLETNGLRLQWSKGETGHVQVVTTRFKPGEFQLNPTWMPEREGEFGLDTAQWASLDRATINDLIRHLRQARDDAFGKDQ